MGITKRELCVKTITGTTSAGAGTRTTHAHGLSWIPTANDIEVIPKATDGDANDAGSVNIVKTDATYVYVKGSAASLPFVLKIWANQDPGERNNNL
jgi:hypothetical protein